MDFGDFGFWILGISDFGFWILGILDFGFWGFWILDLGDFGFWILGPKSKIQNPPIQNPKSKLFWPILDFGFWILDRYVANLCVAPNFGDFGFWILDLDFGFCIWGISDLGILDLGHFGFWILGILDLGDFWIWGIVDFGDFGFWILDRYVANLYVRPPTPQIWGISDFGFWGILWILDFGFWGFWILDFGVWGFWILDFGFCDKFWILHKKKKKKTVHADPGRRILFAIILTSII